MNVALRKPLTLEEFLAWEEGQELRYEFDGFQPVAMTGGSRPHARVCARLVAALVNRVHLPCEAYGADLNPTFATRGQKSPKSLISGGGDHQGRHHEVTGHAGLRASSAVILGGGWAGRLNFNCCSRIV